MNVLAEPAPLSDPLAPVSMAIGVFDGVHLGHAAVVAQTLADAAATDGRAIVVTFDRHPNAIVAPERTPPMLCPLWRRLEALEDLGIDTALVFTFDEAFSRQSGEEFVERLLLGFGRVATVCVGTSFVFGHRRSGDVGLLQRLGKARGFQVHAVPPLTVEGAIVSSSRVRELVAEGRFSETARLLGRPYTLAGTVRRGERVGRQIGFPTANLDVDGLVLPPAGVYAAVASRLGLRRPAAVNIGRRPTLAGSPGPILVEAHMLDFSREIYGQHLELEFGPRLRDEERFDSREALVQQITRDVAWVRQWAGNLGLL